jgi:hypothetical protein
MIECGNREELWERNMKGRLWWGTVLAVAAGVVLAAGQATDGGRVLKAGGQVSIERASSKISTVEKSQTIVPGDTIQTGRDGKVQWWMQDDSLFLLPRNSALHVDQFALPKKDDSSSGASFMTLLKGGMRSITGLVAKNNYEHYHITTPVATMGVRGTDFTLMYCQNDCTVRTKTPVLRKGEKSSLPVFPRPRLIKTADDSATPNGLYLKLNKGSASLCNKGGCVTITAAPEAKSGSGEANGVCAAAVSATEKPRALVQCPKIFASFDLDFEFDFDPSDIEILRDLGRIITEPPASNS